MTLLDRASPVLYADEDVHNPSRCPVGTDKKTADDNQGDYYMKF